MADMDTYDGDQRGYEGDYYRSGASAQTGYYRHSEIDHPMIQYHYDYYISLPRRPNKADFPPSQMIATTRVSVLVHQFQSATAKPGSAMSL